MKCRDIMNRNLEWLSEKHTILEAATIMTEAGVGFLPICDANQHVVGVVTDRDLVTRALAKKLDASTTSAAMVMTTPALTCLESTDVRDAEQLMIEERRGRLAVIDSGGKLVGILSLSDLVEKAPGRGALETLRAILWREAVGPHGGAPRGTPLLKDDPIARAQAPASDDAKARPTVFTGGHRDTDTKEFPG